jgi:hypothetical protein
MSTLHAHQDLDGEWDEQLATDVKNLSDKEKKEFLASSESILSTEAGSEFDKSQQFTSSKTLHVNAQGIGAFRLPIPSRELGIPICNADGSLAYTSTREKISSGNAVLSAPDRGDLVASMYRFGPGRNPKLVMLKEAEGQNEITVSGKWTSRSQVFKYNPSSVTFEWRYRRERRESQGVIDGEAKKPKKVTLITLEVHGAGKDDVRRVAQLVRGEDARTPGTKSCSAGNGGELEIDETAAQGLGIPEELIVSSCIMMLKKEIDRRRATQFIIMSAAASS